ncbi:MAG TPA: DUF3883 domain-containing protein [Solirubrobacterales bacterium]|nr:DUF3883 domain-containing protein [Solirubrobacterales bacterium]
MAEVRELYWRRVTRGDLYGVEVATENSFTTGGGQTFFSLSFGKWVDKESFGRFLGIEPPSLMLSGKPVERIEAAVLTDPAESGELEFSPRYLSGSDDRYRIANQNRQRRDQSRHPAWTAARGFPQAPDDIAAAKDPRMPDVSFLKLIVVRDEDGAYYADYVNSDSAPPGTPPELTDLFRPNREAGPNRLISFTDPGFTVAKLAGIVTASRGGTVALPPAPPEIEDALDAVAKGASRPRSGGGQGFRQSQEEKDAIDKHAMAVASAHLEADGWEVEDVSRNSSYDLRCTREEVELHVEVKGTTTAGAAVLLTPNEVDHARETYPDVALLIVHDVTLEQDGLGEPVAKGGEIKYINPWEIDAEGTLRATGYTYNLL